MEYGTILNFNQLVTTIDPAQFTGPILNTKLICEAKNKNQPGDNRRPIAEFQKSYSFQGKKNAPVMHIKKHMRSQNYSVTQVQGIKNTCRSIYTF